MFENSPRGASFALTAEKLFVLKSQLSPAVFLAVFI
ncbi:MAG: hypothetical protein RL069_2697, partial [Planctomycetota bacterium]